MPHAAGYSVSKLSQLDTWSLNMALHTDLGSSGLPSKIINAFLTASMRPTCSDHLTLNRLKKSKCKTYHQSLKRRKTDRRQGRSRKPHNVPLCHSRRPGQDTLQQLPTFSVSSVKQEDSCLSTRPASSHTSTALSSRPADYPVTARFRTSSAHSMHHRPLPA